MRTISRKIHMWYDSVTCRGGVRMTVAAVIEIVVVLVVIIAAVRFFTKRA